MEKLQAVTPAERLELTVASLRQQAARVLAMDDAHLPDPRRTLNELGFDSLTAVEFCNRVSRSIGQRLNPTVLFDYPTLESLAGYVLRELLAMEPAARICGRRTWPSALSTKPPRCWTTSKPCRKRKWTPW